MNNENVPFLWIGGEGVDVDVENDRFIFPPQIEAWLSQVEVVLNELIPIIKRLKQWSEEHDCEAEMLLRLEDISGPAEDSLCE